MMNTRPDEIETAVPTADPSHRERLCVRERERERERDGRFLMSEVPLY